MFREMVIYIFFLNGSVIFGFAYIYIYIPILSKNKIKKI